MPRDPRTWLFDIIQAGERAQRFLTGQDWPGYKADDLLRAGTERQFEIIGEALNHLRQRAPELAAGIRECDRIIGFRNLLIHGYAIVDDAIVWSAATEKLPLLLDDARQLLAELESGD
jgi:uncharacterized protein with HEPN domain